MTVNTTTGADYPGRTPFVGQSKPALEAPEIVTGALRYVTDLRETGMLHGAVLRSPLPHARIDRLDTARAAALPGVVCVVTGHDVPCNALGPRDVDGPALATDVVRQVGEAIVLVAAETPEQARAAVAAVDLVLDPLPVVGSAEAALAEDAPQLWPAGNVAATSRFSAGDVDAALAGADLVISRTVRTPGQEHVAIDTPGGVASVADGAVTIWCGSQNPGLHQRKVARALALEPDAVRMVANPVGGAFGARNDDPVPVHLALLAWASGRPVRLHLTREDVMAAGAKRHPFRTEITMGFDSTGRILGSRMTALADTGPVVTSGPNVLKTSAEMSTGPYGFEHAAFDGTVVYTNNANAGAFRGYGVPQVAFAVELVLTEAADRLGLDPGEIRRRNVLAGGARHSLYRHEVTEGLAAREALETALAHPLWTGRASWKAAAGPVWRRGTGIAMAMKGVGMGSGTGDAARARLRVDDDGEVTIWAGPNHTGQSIHTTYTQVAADVLGLPFESVHVVVGDTAVVPESGPTAASRSTYAGGGAVRAVCDALLEECARLGLPWSTDPAGVGEKLLRLGLAEHEATFRLPDTADRGLVPEADLARYSPHRVYGSCVQVVRVEVNRHTGELRVPDVLCVVDCGTPINPGGVVGQAEGGLLQGLGMAVMEEHLLREGRVLTTSLENYLIPTIVDTPRMETILVPGSEPTGPYGAKGMSEVVVVPVGPALAGAVHDAVGVFPTQLPVTPERMLDLIATEGM
ncbi:xanthine dehydrogenase family protein molybdopterin-binding subunit [Georgenia sp. H159]|uniref:xanthine dehydrogenase family protein molybdopterin-binding subunit n=1 Tax=Georgenia sp. H159 TaxID=3076115 RepID=UPI002D77C730|nr:xanthine dehydrogenase family protein molybdopterin-binding subunit [Georgenia sp. H159]